MSERYRTENKELRPLAERAKEAEEAGKSELQKAQERIAALEAEKQESVLCCGSDSTAPRWGHFVFVWHDFATTIPRHKGLKQA